MRLPPRIAQPKVKKLPVFHKKYSTIKSEDMTPTVLSDRQIMERYHSRFRRYCKRFVRLEEADEDRILEIA